MKNIKSLLLLADKAYVIEVHLYKIQNKYIFRVEGATVKNYVKPVINTTNKSKIKLRQNKLTSETLKKH